MKSIFVHMGTEYRFESTSQRFVQGGAFECSLHLKNRGTSSQSYSSVVLALRSAAKGKEVTEELLRAEVGDLPWRLDAGQERKVVWRALLPANCPLGEKGSELAFVFGADESALQRMPVVVEMHPSLAKLARLLETLHQFPFKGAKSAKGWTELKFKPSESSRFSTVEDLLLGGQFVEEGLELRWKFKVKKFSATSTSLSVGKVASELRQTVTAKDLQSWESSHDDRVVLNYIEAALAEVASGF
ncbi:MAG: hypothetical protein QY326_07180 [Bdellovibrionota bacterium]|nr:MAG: hypothetical protein QY326_07180 [Bdellovibrionota bacterium]